jgi:hypothetical protein
MAKQTIGIGAAPDDGTGDPLRTAFTKANSNFTELYNIAHPGHVTGGTRTYPAFPRIAAASATVATVANTVYYTPFLVTEPITIDRFSIQTGSANATAANALFGIYASSAGKPAGKLFTINAVAVAVPATTSTVVTVTPDAGTITLDPGFYWFAVVFTAAPAMNGTGADSLMAWYFGTTNAAAFFANTSQGGGYNQASATLPATATPVFASSAQTSMVYRVA